jgi:ABC-type antimicrobial peptide transport system permease subunit
MSLPPVLRFGSRARSTSLGIALCTMFMVASFSVVSGLSASVDKLEQNFTSDLFLVTMPGPSGPSFFDPSDVLSVAAECAYGTFVEVEVNATPSTAMVFYVDDQRAHTIPGLDQAYEGTVYAAGTAYPEKLRITHAGISEEVTLAERDSVDEFMDEWLLGSHGLLANLTGEPTKVNFAIAESLTQGQRGDLASMGFSVQAMTGIIDFLGQSMDQIQDDVLLVLVPSSFVVAVLSYGFIGAEVADRRHDIGILKTIGARRSKILRMLLANALLISLWGGVLGLAFGIVLSYGISTAASSLFTSVFLMSIEPIVLALAFLSTIAAGMVGALLPTLRMTMSSPIRDLREGSS